MDIIGIVKIGTDLPLLNIVYDHEESLWKKSTKNSSILLTLTFLHCIEIKIFQLFKRLFLIQMLRKRIIFFRINGHF